MALGRRGVGLGAVNDLRQEDVLDWVRRFIADHNYAPIIGDIAAGMDMGTTTAHHHIRALEKKGYIRRVAPRVWEVSP